MNNSVLVTSCCRFVDQSDSLLDSLQILHFIREAKQSKLKNWKTVAYYQLCYVFNGCATLQMSQQSFKLEKGTLFLLFPGGACMIDAEDDFIYTYIGFLGKRANKIADKCRLSSSNCVFYNLTKLEQIWIDALTMDSEMLSLSAESVLLFSFASLGKDFTPLNTEKDREQKIAEKIKDYIDINFANQDLSVQTIGEELSYSAKYISAIFKKHYNILLKSYLNTIRIQNACALIEKEHYCVKEIAFLCGFGDPLYFSKIFKQKLGISPTEQIEDCKKRKNSSQVIV